MIHVTLHVSRQATAVKSKSKEGVRTTSSAAVGSSRLAQLDSAKSSAGSKIPPVSEKILTVQGDPTVSPSGTLPVCSYLDTDRARNRDPHTETNPRSDVAPPPALTLDKLMAALHKQGIQMQAWVDLTLKAFTDKADKKYEVEHEARRKKTIFFVQCIERSR